MAEIIVPPILQVLFEKLASKAGTAVKLYLLNEKRGKGLPDTIKRWKEKLGEMEAVLSDAEQQQFRSKAVQKWLHDLQDWAYDLEDVLDEFATDFRLKELDLESREEDDSPPTCSCSPFNKVPSFLTCNSEASDSKNETFLTKIGDISNRLEAILSRVGTLNLLQRSLSMEEPHKERPKTSSISPPVVFGRDDEKGKIIHRLLTDELRSDQYGNYTVIPVVGQGGIGKTTLAQSVYNDEQVKAHFDIKAWVCVSDVFDVHQITTTIISSASNHASSVFNSLHGTQETLQNILSGKRFLIALDDVWSDEYSLWEQLQAPFQGGSKGSRVLVTTRIERVAKTMMTTPAAQRRVVHLKGLSDNECWNVCKQHALIRDDPIETRTQVTRMSKGLPLAAKALGGLLKKSDRRNWSTILRSTIWSEETGVLPALRLSYYHLPHHLKRVFAYCSVFPKDHKMFKEDIVLMWMAEGFLPESQEESMEYKGHSYFDDLVSRSFFEPSSRHEVRYFIMHDLIHDLAQWAAGDVCCRIEIDEPTDRTRFLSFTSFGRERLIEVKVGDAGRQLRTFIFWRYGYCLKRYDFTFRQFQCLRVLCIAEADIVELSSYIGNLKHLRLVDLSFNPLKELPESMSKLCNLQSLLLKSCLNLKKVLNMEHFVELRHLDIEGSALLEMPSGFEKLTNLRTSRRFIIAAKCGPRIRDLENLKYLGGSLDILGLENVMTIEDAERARTNEKLHLEILRMFWGTLRHGDEVWFDSESNLMVERCNRQAKPSVEREVLNQLQPPKTVKELELNGYMGITFPDWLGSPSFNKMVVIRLKRCSICECLPPVGQLPALQELQVKKLHGIKSIGLEFYGVGCLNPFPALKILQIQSMEHLEGWLSPSSGDGNRAFPCLERLSIESCSLLQGDIPSFLPSLNTLRIQQCKKLKVTLPSSPLLQNLLLRECRELCSIEPVICCSRSVQLSYISSFSGFEGFWVPNIVTLSVVGTYDQDASAIDTFAPFYPDANFAKYGHIYLVRCPKLLSWRPDVYGELTNLTELRLGNCEEWNVFLETTFPSSVRRLKIYKDDSIKHISKLTKQSTCLEELRIQRSSLITVSNLPTTLQVLHIYQADIEQPAKEWKLHLLTSLRQLKIHYGGRSTDSVESIPDPDLPLPSSLVALTIFGFQNLKFISCNTLPYLAELNVDYCLGMTRGGVHVPQGFIFKSDGGMCRLRLNDSIFQLH